MIYLKQLFEDGGAGSAGAAGADDKGGQEKPEGQKKSTDGMKYSDADVKRIMQKKISQWQRRQQKKRENLTVDQEIEDLKNQVSILRKENKRAEILSEIRKEMEGESVRLSDDLINMVINPDDPEASKRNARQLMKVARESLRYEIKDALRGKVPLRGGSSIWTKETIMKVKDREKRQRLIAEHMDLFR